ncbi:MAG: amidohydrolase family protein, partial [Verrucomicrobiales bacterium]
MIASSKAQPPFSSPPNHVKGKNGRLRNVRRRLPSPLLILCVLRALCGESLPADLVLLDAQVLTVDASDSIHQALAIEGERILAVGNNAEIEKHIDAATRVLRLGGKTVVPGFIETHCHAIGVARASLAGNHIECADIGEIQAWIRERAAATPPGTWLRVPRVPITRLRERRHPTIAELDAAATTHPVVYTSARKDILNTLGLRLIGVPLDPNAELPKGVTAARDERGTILALAGAGGLIRKRMPPPIYTQAETDAALLKVLAIYNRVGITSIFERATDIDGYRSYRRLHEQ